MYIYAVTARRRRVERKIKMIITKDTIIGDILDEHAEQTAPYFIEMGMHCLGCPSARGDSLEMACAVHGVDVDQMVADINAYLASK